MFNVSLLRGFELMCVVAIGEWYDAETYHQLYLDKNPGGYECPAQ